MEELLRQFREIRDRASAVASEAATQSPAQPLQEGWTVAQCFDHLARTNSLYLERMLAAAARARTEGVEYKKPRTEPGFWGRLFVRSLEPSSYSPRMKSPAIIQPSTEINTANAFEAFLRSHEQIEKFADTNRDLDMTGILFQSPLASFVKLSVATGLHAVAAHERRHIVQAERALRQPHP